ncbi:Na/H antiporter [Trichophaea hybrida]|nr:Na/H antiporter [Trichophaea hybrida]
MSLLQPTDFNIICAVLGGFVSLFGLVSYFVKERLFLSEALIALVFGLALGPHGANFIRPQDYANGDRQQLESITLAFSRLVLGVQLVLAGVQLPKNYLMNQRRSLAMLLGPIMVLKWIVSSFLVWWLVPGTSYVVSLAVAACITPTDPILANNIVKGKFADAHIPPNLQKIITAESGANDGLGYPFLFVALYVLKYCVIGAPTYHGGATEVAKLWIFETVGYVVLLSVAYGALIGWLARKSLQWAEKRKLVDRESFLVFAIALALFIVGTCGMIGSDDVLACFIAVGRNLGNVFTLDDWFRLETMDDSLQPTIDMLLNMTIFLWFGAVCPWSDFVNTPELPLGRLVLLSVLIILLRRPPIVLAFYRWVPRIESFRQAVFAGYFGPIGVSAIFYLFLTCDYLTEMDRTPGLPDSGRKEVEEMLRVIKPVVWMCVVTSVIVHGITIPFIMVLPPAH